MYRFFKTLPKVGSYHAYQKFNNVKVFHRAVFGLQAPKAVTNGVFRSFSIFFFKFKKAITSNNPNPKS